MTIRYPEPRNEAEAQALKRFLRNGAPGGLETLTSDRSTEAAVVGGISPATLSFQTRTSDLLEATVDPSVRVVVTIELAGSVSQRTGFEIYVQNRGVPEDREHIESTLLATIALFCHGSGPNGVCEFPETDPYRVRLDATDAVRRVGGGDGVLELTVMFAPNAENQSSDSELRFGALVERARSLAISS